MRGRMPPASAPYLFGLLLSAFMSLLVSGIATFKALGFSSEFLSHWAGSWLTSWVIAFPIVLVVAPIVRRMVAYLTTPVSPKT